MNALDEYLQAKKAFGVLLAELYTAGLALKQTMTPDERVDLTLAVLTSEKYDELRRHERDAIEALRRTTGRPSRREILWTACEEAGVTRPRAPDPDYEEDWLDATAREAPLENRAEARRYLEAARRFAADDRPLSALHMLERFKALLASA